MKVNISLESAVHYLSNDIKIKCMLTEIKFFFSFENTVTVLGWHKSVALEVVASEL